MERPASTMTSTTSLSGADQRFWADQGRAFAVLLAVLFFAYGPALHGGLVWDDEAHVTAPALQGASGLARIWLEVGATQQYYPVLHTAFWLEHRLWGDSTLGYHLVNVLLHAVAAGLFALLLQRLAVPGAWFAAALFALHPIQAESVAWISEQKNTLSAVFYLGAALAYLAYAEKRSAGRYALATLLFVLALLSKSVTATLPAALLVVAWWRKGRLSWREDVRPLVPWFAGAVAMGLLTAWVERTQIGARGEEFELSLLQRSLLAGRVVWFYLGKMVWPADLTFIYPRWTIDSGAAAAYVYPLVALAVLVALWRFRARSRAPLAAALLYGGTLFPVLGFVNVYPFRFSFVADHFQYLAGLAVIALVAAAAARASASWGAVRQTAAGLLLVILAVLTARQASDYRDAETLYRATLERNPRCWLAQNNLGNLLSLSGRAAEALPLFDAALLAGRDLADVHANRGGALKLLGRYPEAVAAYDQALRLRADFSKAEAGLGDVLRRMGRVPEAIVRFENAVRLEPRSADAHSNLGVALSAAGRLEDAAARYQAALAIDPRHPDAHNNLGATLLSMGRAEEALVQFQEALRVRNDHADTHANLAACLAALGRGDEAVAEYELALRLDPNHADAALNLGNLYYAMSRFAEAATQYEAALRLQPESPHLLSNLASALAETGRTEEAIGRYQESLELMPDVAERHRYLGITLAEAGRFPEAFTHLRRALALAPGDAETRAALDDVTRQARGARTRS